MLAMFNTIYGRHRFKILPFSIIPAQDEFQQGLDKAYEGLPGVAVIGDDIMAAPNRNTMPSYVP